MCLGEVILWLSEEILDQRTFCWWFFFWGDLSHPSDSQLSSWEWPFPAPPASCPVFCGCLGPPLPAPAQNCMSQAAWSSGKRVSTLAVRVTGHPVSICNVKSGSVVTRSSDVMYTTWHHRRYNKSMSHDHDGSWTFSYAPLGWACLDYAVWHHQFHLPSVLFLWICVQTALGGGMKSP